MDVQLDRKAEGIDPVLYRKPGGGWDSEAGYICILIHLLNATNRKRQRKINRNQFRMSEKKRGGGGTARLRIYVCTPHYTREVR